MTKDNKKKFFKSLVDHLVECNMCYSGVTLNTLKSSTCILLKRKILLDHEKLREKSFWIMKNSCKVG